MRASFCHHVYRLYGWSRSWKTPVFTAHLVFLLEFVSHILTHSHMHTCTHTLQWWNLCHLHQIYGVYLRTWTAIFYFNICFLFWDVSNFWIPAEQKSDHEITWNCHWWFSLMIMIVNKWRNFAWTNDRPLRADYDCVISSSENRADLLFKASQFSPHPGEVDQGCFGCKVTCKSCNICMSVLIPAAVIQCCYYCFYGLVRCVIFNIHIHG